CARLPVISAERRESAHMEELPNKRAARMVRVEATNVFAVGVWNSRFGHTYYLPEVVNLAPVHPGVLSSKRAEVELEPVDPYQRAPACKRRAYEIYVLRRYPVPGHDLRPAFIIDGHGTSRIFTLLPAQIGNSVPHLCACIAEAGQ